MKIDFRDEDGVWQKAVTDRLVVKNSVGPVWALVEVDDARGGGIMVTTRGEPDFDELMEKMGRKVTGETLTIEFGRSTQ